MTRPAAIAIYSGIGLISALLGFIFGVYIGLVSVLLHIG